MQNIHNHKGLLSPAQSCACYLNRGDVSMHVVSTIFNELTSNCTAKQSLASSGVQAKAQQLDFAGSINQVAIPHMHIHK